MTGTASEVDSSWTRGNASNQLEYPKGLLGKYSAADLRKGTCDAQQQTATGIIQTSNEVDHDTD